jgi:4-aminobutyrate aminotransferase-like enzyme/Ser/Thr protein kinase RdoA (MazF antagonist)
MTAIFDYFEHVELPMPKVDTDEAEALAASEFGLEARLESLGSQQDQNFLVRRPGDDVPIGVLKLSNPVFSEAEIELQIEATRRVGADRGLRVPRVVDGDDGPLSGWWDTSQGRLHARVIEYISGSTLTGSGYLSPRTVAAMGNLAGRTSLALAGFEHPGAARTLQWDLRHALRVIEVLAEREPDAGIRAQALAAATAARPVLDRVGGRLPRQIGHWDVTDDNLLRLDAPGALPDAIIDFGDVSESWAIGELAVTLASVLHHAGATPLTTLPAIRAFHAVRAISSDEADALWPLVGLRGAVLVLSGRDQLRADADNAYATARMAGEHSVLRQALSLPAEVMTRTIRHQLGLPLADAPRWPGGPVVPVDGDVVVLDAGPVSELNDDGRWQDPDGLAAAVRAAFDDGAPAVVLPAGLPVLTGAPSRTSTAPATVPTAATLWLAEPAAIGVPDGAALTYGPDGTTVTLDDVTLAIRGAAGDGRTLLAHRPISVTLRRSDAPAGIPPWVEAGYAAGWQAIVGDPAPALGVTCPDAPHEDVIRRRERVLAQVQEHYYAEPPQIERGWREYLADTDGRVYLDMVNNVTAIGHAHPRVAEAASRQLRLLNTNSRFNYAAIAEYAERVAATLPDELDTVFFVNSGSEAVDLAIRLAMAATGRQDIVAMREAYHGWTYASDAVSTSIADNPNALATRPRWVHLVDAANSYRGKHRGGDASRYAPEAVAAIRELAAHGHDLAGFICESYFGNAGGIALPDYYLREVYAAVRELGGLAIADEVQVGFGRLGRWFWGFQQQEAVPDIVAVAKSVGNGQPIGIVITRRDIAERYRAGGYFFSSTGGSTLSSVIGLTVLDVIQREGLQENARIVGAHLRQRLQDLKARHEIVGAVHGDGLYLGLEFVRDRMTLEPATEETAAICDRLLELGVIMQPTGDHQNVLKIKPPLCVTADSVDYFADMLDHVLTTGW